MMIKTSICTFAALLMTSATALAEPQPRAPEGPADADLRFHFACSEVAMHRLLTFDEATVCGMAFQRIKLSFVPGVGEADYEELAPTDRSVVNRVGYERYLDWSAENPKVVEALKEEARANFVLAAD